MYSGDGSLETPHVLMVLNVVQSLNPYLLLKGAKKHDTHFSKTVGRKNGTVLTSSDRGQLSFTRYLIAPKVVALRKSGSR